MTRPQVAVVIEETFPDSLYDQATSGCGNRRDLSRLSLRPGHKAVVIEETFPDSL